MSTGHTFAFRLSHDGHPSFHYRFAGHDVVTDTLVALLEPYRVVQTHSLIPLADLTHEAEIASHIANHGTQICSERLHAGDTILPLTVKYYRDNYLVSTTGVDRFLVMPARRMVARVAQPGDTMQEPHGLAELILGPLLLPLLAFRETLCLHASAVTTDQGCLAFLGESGAGKSTLAAYLDNAKGFTRVADDMLPFRCVSGRVQGVTAFPQPKLHARSAPVNAFAEITCLFLLKRVDGNTEVSARRLTGNDALRAMVSQVVASRTFGPGLIRTMLSTCARASQMTRIFELNYPSGIELLPRIGEFLLDMDQSDTPSQTLPSPADVGQA